MPELPEVENYARDLAAALTGRSLLGASGDWPNQLPLGSIAALDAGVRGQTIASVGRRGKYLVFALGGDWLIIPLKMSGRLQVVPASDPRNPHAHVVFRLDRGDELRFHDPRKFGRVYLVADPGAVLGPLGPEPLGADLTLDAFRGRWATRRGRLKPLLLDQTFIAGLGNIYVDESLWEARLHPLRTASSLNELEVEHLYHAIRAVLERGIAARGTSFSTAGYRDLTGNPGEMQGSLAVFRRTGQPCPICGAPVERLRVGARSTHVCPRCQR